MQILSENSSNIKLRTNEVLNCLKPNLRQNVDYKLELTYEIEFKSNLCSGLRYTVLVIL